MPSDFNKIIYALPKFSRKDYISYMRTLENILGFDTSEMAKFRFHVLEVFYASGWKGVGIAFPKLKRATLYRWKKKYEASGKRLNSLLPKSTKPHHTRVMLTPPSVVALITQLRKDYPRLGKMKIKPFVDAFCATQGIKTLDESTIGKVIKRRNLFFAGKSVSRGKRVRNGNKTRIRLCPKASEVAPGYIQLDGVKFYYLGKYYFFLTAVDIVSKQAWLKLVPRLNSTFGAEFLKGILSSSWHKIHTIQTDNGSEFESYFERVSKENNLTHLWNYPKHPKTTGYVERFNWTIQDEFLFDTEDFLLYPEEFTVKLNTWINWYNQVRPHQSLGYLSPYQYLQERRLSQKY